ncbi:MAG TPA: 2-dehydropantoate 2-reductase [Blastocatellia bacterium]|nr:2-dehydropantoate 2-reductase [Blastocatellia bacterium]
MSAEKPVRFVIVGAGAIGLCVGALLGRMSSAVKFVARPAIAEALKRGVRIKQPAGELTLAADAVTSIGELTPKSGDIITLTTKSQATESAVDDLAAVYDRSQPVFCLQNGIRNEETAARRFENVYAGLVLLCAVQLEPGLITYPEGREVAVGCYPRGADDTARYIADEFKRAGFDAAASAHVMAMKWGKLVANLNNATHTITGFWLERGMADADMRRLMLEVREEGLRVLDAAGIAVEPPPDEPSPIRIRAMTERLRRPPKETDEATTMPEEKRSYASMWQDLYLGRKTHEGEFLNGEIIALARGLGMSTPYNSTLLEVINRMFSEGLKPGILSPAELRSLIRRRADGHAG